VNSQLDKSAEPPVPRLFNSDVETGLRIAFLLDAGDRGLVDLERLVSYDYLLVHSGDVESGPPSLHPAVPFRGSEWLVKRGRIQNGMDLLIARELADKVFSDGIFYRASALTTRFLHLLKSGYSSALRSRADWVISTFGKYSDRELANYMTERVGRWGAEFDGLSVIQEVEF